MGGFTFTVNEKKERGEHRRHKIKHHKHHAPRQPTENYEKRMKEEIGELLKKKQEMPKQKGFFGGLKNVVRAGSINAEINRRKGYLSREQQMKNINQITKLTGSQIELKKKQEELKKLRGIDNIAFDSLGQLGSTKKVISEKDIFG
jgi:hypothetical protein